MAFFENETCPVCKRLFEEDDDIVVCPVCGTPHHRDCYQLSGHCVNEGLHASGFVYQRTAAKQKEEETPAFDGMFARKEQENAPEQPVMPPFIAPFDPAAAYQNDTATIDGESVADVATTVRSNTQRFVRVFKRLEEKGSSLSWNWGAFFFGAYYYFFRKMYKAGALLAAISAALNVCLPLLLGKLAPVSASVYQELLTNTSAVDAMKAEGMMAKLYAASDYHKFTYIVLLSFALNILINVLAALLFDHLYKQSVTALIKRVSQTISDGASFRTAGFGTADTDMSQEQMRRLYLARKGGVSFAAPLLLATALYAFDWIINHI